MRGKVSAAACAFSCIGITPAYAGKSAPYISPVSVSKDHPRICGEKTKKIP